MAKETTALEQVLIDTIQGASKATGEVYDASKAGLSKAIDYAQVQIPDVIHQFLLWHLVESLLIFIVALLIFIWSFWITRKFIISKKGDGFYNDAQPLSMFSGAIVIVSFLVMFGNLDWLQIMIAPKVYLLEYVTDLIKHNNVKG